MAETKWTKEQKTVIDIRDKNVLVSAAAGSGKTAVLVERIISIVTGEGGNTPVDIDKLLVVTFTRAAAGEMRERVLKALEKKAFEQPLNEHLRKQMTYIHSAKITTIDSFCADVVREHFSEIDLDPAFKVGDTGELTLLKSDVVAKVLEDNYLRGEEGFLKFIDIYSGSKSDSDIEDIILRLYDFSQSYPSPEKWLGGLVDAYNQENAHQWLTVITDEIQNKLEDAVNSMETAIELCSDGNFDKYRAVIDDEKERLISILGKSDFDEIGTYIKAFSFGRLPALKGLSEDEELYKKQIQTIRDGYKKTIKKLGTKYFTRRLEDILQDVYDCMPVVATISKLVGEFSDRYKEAKKEKDLVDFSDLEHYALNILVKENEQGDYSPTETAMEISKDFYEVMIDEYQDSNLVQEIILSAVSGRGENIPNVFMVGDVKQSIYKFRLARPELFLHKYNTYTAVEEEGDSKKIVLSKNFRSRYQVLDFCNMVFKQIMTKELGGISYDKENMLYPGFDYPKSDENEYKPEILFIDTAEENEALQDEEPLSNIELEAALTAAKIKALVYGEDGHKPLSIYDKESGQLRGVRFSDIAILFRSTARYAEVYTEVFTAEGIPVYTNLSEGYFDTFEIGQILDLLSVIDNPRQDIKLAAVLRNIFGLTENMLADIRIGKDTSFYQAFMEYDGIYGNIVSEIKDKISAYRHLVSFTSIYDLICHVIEDTHFRQFIMSGKAGEKRLANVEMLLEKAKTYEEGPYSGLFNFVRYIEKLKKYKVEQGEAMAMSENDDSVKIMTIHKSKGLEYPVVFAGGMGKLMNMRDSAEKIALHHELGIGINRVDTAKRLRYKTLIKEAIGSKLRLENIAEELRVLYVAMTRAREKLILTGIGNVTSKLDKLSGCEKHIPVEFSPATISGAGSYMDWILMSLIRGYGDNISIFKRISPADILYNKIKATVTAEDRKKALKSWDRDKIYDPELRRSIRGIFDYTYEYEEECQIRSKMSISDIKHMYMKLVSEDERPVEDIDYFAKNKEDSIDSAKGAMRGTAYHRVFELFDYDKTVDSVEDIKSMIKNMVEKGLIDSESAALVNPKKIKAFSDSPLAGRMRTAYKENKLYREKPFVMGIPACAIDPEKYKSRELVVVQGIVDAWFIEDDEIVLVDYKTDGVSRIEELCDRYESQLKYYGEALSKIINKKVKSRIIYSVKFEDILEV